MSGPILHTAADSSHVPRRTRVGLVIWGTVGTVTLTAADVAAPVARYARRLHAVAGPRHHVASPLAAWLLLALCAPASSDDSLNAILGCDAGHAAELAAGLLAEPHPAVPAAAAAWHRPVGVSDLASHWLAGLPPEVETGPLPDQAGLNDWARRHTSGLIGEFPVRVDPSLYLLVATVLATKVSWERPFDLAPAGALGARSPWADRLTRVLRTPDGPGHEQFVAATGAGDVAVHAVRAREGLLVVSVAAAPEVPAGDVLAVAYDLATALGSAGPVPRRSLFDLPLGEAPLWTLTEQTAASAREERCTAVLPAWSARTELDLSRPELGFAAAAQALAPGDPWQARQAAAASYDRTGFEAAAVSALAVAMSMRVPRRGVVRTAELRFAHPYAVVAVAVPELTGPEITGPEITGPERTSRGRASSPWNGLPVFSAWVAEPQDAA